MPDAAVCANDQMAIGVLRALTAAGVRVPGVVAVTGFDDLYPGRLADPPLSTVSQPMRMLGQRACARLLDRIANPGLSPAAQMLPTSSCCGKAAAACPARSPASPSQPSSPVELTSKRHHPPVPAGRTTRRDTPRHLADPARPGRVPVRRHRPSKARLQSEGARLERGGDAPGRRAVD